MLMNSVEDDREGQDRIAAFQQGLEARGWVIGRNLRIDIRWGAIDLDSSRPRAAEIVMRAPDVVLATTSATMEAALQTTRTVPIVFMNIIDPVAAG